MPAASWLTPAYLSRLDALQLSVRWVRAGTRIGGRFPVNRRGSSIEFADYAPYAPGDDIRAIDWHLYARLDRLFVRTYKEEIQLTVELLVDATESMRLPTPEKFERARQLAVSLGYIGVSDRHHVRLTWITPGALRTSPWYTQRRDVVRMLEAAEAVTPGGQVGWAEWMRRTVAAQRIHGGQTILITDGMVPPAEFFRAVHLLTVRNVEVKVIQVLTAQELRPEALVRGGVVVDAETGATHELAYSGAELARAVAEHNEQLVRFCKRHGVPFARYVVEEPLEAFVVKTLPTRGFVE
jgi:uncharacterized protein (DUF58 family)